MLIAPKNLHSVNNYSSSSSSGGAYTGPLDLVPGARFAHSQRQMAAAFTSNAIRIKRESDSQEASYPPTSSNQVNVAQITTFLSGTVPSEMTLYDQSGNGLNLINAINSCPGWTVLPASARPTIGPNALLESIVLEKDEIPANSVTEVTWFVVAYIHPDQTATNCILNVPSTAGNAFIKILLTAGFLSFIIQNESASSCEWYVEGSYGGLHVIECHVDASGTAQILVDGVVQDATPLDTPIPAELTSGYDIDYLLPHVPGSGVVSAIYESLFYASDLSSANRTTLRQDMTAWYVP